MLSKNFLLSSAVHLLLAATLFLLLYHRESAPAYVPFELQLDSVHVHHFDEKHEPKAKRADSGISVPKHNDDQKADALSTEATAESSASDSQTGGPTGPSDAASRYLSQLLQLISHQKFYPKASLLNEETGTVEARITLNSSGNLLHAEIKKSSGFPNLDAAALKTLQSISLFPAPPAELPNPLTIVVPIRYELNPDHL